MCVMDVRPPPPPWLLLMGDIWETGEGITWDQLIKQHQTQNKAAAASLLFHFLCCRKLWSRRLISARLYRHASLLLLLACGLAVVHCAPPVLRQTHLQLFG